MLAATKISNKQTKHTDNHFIDKYPGITRSVVNAAKSATENYLNNLIQLQKKKPNVLPHFVLFATTNQFKVCSLSKRSMTLNNSFMYIKV